MQETEETTRSRKERKGIKICFLGLFINVYLGPLIKGTVSPFLLYWLQSDTKSDQILNIGRKFASKVSFSVLQVDDNNPFYGTVYYTNDGDSIGESFITNENDYYGRQWKCLDF